MEAILSGVLSPDDGTRKKAEQALQHAESTRPSALSGALLDFVDANCTLAGSNARIMALVRLALVLLRRVALEANDFEMITTILKSKAIHAPSSEVRGGLAQAFGLMLVRGQVNHVLQKLDHFRQQALAFHKEPNRQDFAVKTCLKTVKVISAMARDYDRSEMGLPEQLSPILEMTLDPRYCFAYIHEITQVAWSMRKLSESSDMVTATKIPDSWLSKLLGVMAQFSSLGTAPSLQASAKEITHLYCETIHTLRRLTRGRDSPRQFQDTAFKLAFQIVSTSLAEKESSQASEETEEAYDSDDGEPCGTQALLSSSLELLREKFSSVVPESESKEACVQAVQLCVKASVIDHSLAEMFLDDPNEFIALHEDESAPNCTRHSAVAWIVELAETQPEHVTAAVLTLVPQISTCLGVEAALWLLGNLWLFFVGDDQHDQLERIGQLAFPLIRRIVESSASEHQPEALLHARVLWAIWACWSNELATPEIFRFVLASFDKDDTAVALGLHASRALVRCISRLPSLVDQFDPILNHLFVLIRSSSEETVHIVMETLEILLELLADRSLPLSESQAVQLVTTMVHTWNSGLDQDPMVGHVVVNIVCERVLSGNIGQREIAGLFDHAPSLLAAVIDRCGDAMENVPNMAKQSLDVTRDYVQQANTMDSRCLSLCDCTRALLCALSKKEPAQALSGTPSLLQMLEHIYSSSSEEDAKTQALLEIGSQAAKEVLQAARLTGLATEICQFGNASGKFLLRLTIFDVSMLCEVSMCLLHIGNADWLDWDSTSAQLFLDAALLEAAATSCGPVGLHVLVGGMALVCRQVEQMIDYFRSQDIVRKYMVSPPSIDEGLSPLASASLQADDLWTFGQAFEIASSSTKQDSAFVTQDENQIQVYVKAAHDAATVVFKQR